MNTHIIKATGLLFLLCFFVTSIRAQSDLEKSYTWDNESDKVTLEYTVQPNAKELAMSFNGKVTKGNLVVSSYDPEGNRECGFCLITDCSLPCGTERDKIKGTADSEPRSDVKCSVSSTTEDGVTKTRMKTSGNGYSYLSNSTQNDAGAKGNAIETISDPTPGKWTFVIEAIEGTGNLELQVRQK